jgi:hypothetical protein
VTGISTALYYIIILWTFRSRNTWPCLPLAPRWFLARLILRPSRWWRYVPPKRRLTFNGLHGVYARSWVLFITTAVRTSNPTQKRVSDVKILSLNISHLMYRTGYRSGYEFWLVIRKAFGVQFRTRN